MAETTQETTAAPPAGPAEAAGESFAAMLDESLGNVERLEGTVLKGTVIAIEGDNAVVDVGLKSEGRISLKEFAEPGRTAELEPDRTCGDGTARTGRGADGLDDIRVDKMWWGAGRSVQSGRRPTDRVLTVRDPRRTTAANPRRAVP